MSVYRSGLRGFTPALAHGGHGFVIVAPPPGFDDDPESFPETPMLLRCLRCHVILADFELHEQLYPRPCVGTVRALTKGS